MSFVWYTVYQFFFHGSKGNCEKGGKSVTLKKKINSNFCVLYFLRYKSNCEKSEKWVVVK